ncbi:hypothetical protein HRR83_002768 [Exophiala dermatitidis]|uniref:Uncharacterized protein n=1 Tax=Exophiala dermatitidis TaxID=5970 RepID=A0AAN6IWI5_EXODE
MASSFNATSHRFRAFCDTNTDAPAARRTDTRSDRIPDAVDTIPTVANETGHSAGDMKLQCCCGRSECIYLEHNNTLLGGIEKDLETAARLGQALLTRHESYVNESQLEHERLTLYINELEKERTCLQTTNERIAVENRELRTQLDAANTSLKDSDNHVKSLEALLRDSESEIRRLNGLTRRAEELELKILDMEKDQMKLSQRADDFSEETRSTIRRWKESEIKVRQLESDVERIEWEAKQERERHEEIVARLERERVLERELGGAEGRLKGAAALQGLKGGVSGTNVVSHFVRDILQDNANLQAGIAELRELLQASNDEVQSLREQIMQHQPIESDNIADDGTPSRPLSQQLGWQQPSPKQVQQEVHVHHHYHAKIAAKRGGTSTVRKSARRRAVMGISTLPATPESSTPSTPLSGPQRVVSSPVLPIALHFPQARRARWSVQSAATTSSAISSFASSPRSYFDHSSSIFDRFEAGDESSRPTSPESATGFLSPRILSGCRDVEVGDCLTDLPEDEEAVGDDQPQEADFHAPSDRVEDHSPEPGGFDSSQSDSHDLTPKPSQVLVTDGERQGYMNPVPSDDYPQTPSAPPEEESETVSVLPATDQEAEAVTSSPCHDQTRTDEVPRPNSSYGFDDMAEAAFQPRLRRTGSHESLVSISGMDIHLAKRPTTSGSRPSTLLKGNKAYFAMSPSAARTFSAAPLTTVTEFTAISSTRSTSSPVIPGRKWTDNTSSAKSPSPSDKNATSVSVELLSGLAGLPTVMSPTERQPSSGGGGLGRLVGSWVKGKWGIAPMKSSEDMRPSTSVSNGSSNAQSSTTEEHPLLPFQWPGGRPPGINQKGAIPGFPRPARRPPAGTGVQVKMVDADGLREILAEADHSGH